MDISGEESLWAGLKFQGFFEDYNTYEDYQNRNKKVKTITQVEEENQIRENIRKSEEIQEMKDNYNPKPTNPKELKEYERRRKEKEHEKWVLENIVTPEQKRRWEHLKGIDRPIKKVDQKKLDEIARDNADSQANFDKFIGNKK